MCFVNHGGENLGFVGGAGGVLGERWWEEEGAVGSVGVAVACVHVLVADGVLVYGRPCAGGELFDGVDC